MQFLIYKSMDTIVLFYINAFFGEKKEQHKHTDCNNFLLQIFSSQHNVTDIQTLCF